MKKTLIHLHSSPYSSLACKEGLDLALVLGTFEQDVDLCLSGGAVILLNKMQSPTPEQGKNLHKLLDGLEFYDIENIFVQADSIPDNMETWSGIQRLSSQEWANLFSKYHHVFRF